MKNMRRFQYYKVRENMKTLKITSAFLILSLLLTMLMACASNGNGTDVTTEQPAETTTEALTTSRNDTYKDMKWNDSLKVFTWKEVVSHEFLTECTEGNVYEEAIVNRLTTIKEKNGIEFKVYTKQGNWENRSAFIKAVESNQSETGNKAYDIIGCYAPIVGEMAVKGFLDNLANENEYEYLEIGTGFWPENYENAARVNNAIYSLTGVITSTYYQNMSVVHVNLDMLERYNPGVDIYKLVKEKQWTYEKLEELALGHSTAYGDKTVYGFTMGSTVAYDDILYSGGYRLVENYDDGAIGLADHESDSEFIEFTKYAYGLLNSNEEVALLAINAKANASAGTGAGFTYGNVMFNLGNLSQVKSTLQDVDFKVGIIPVPMYETSTNKDYATLHSFWVTNYGINCNSDDKALSSFALNRLQYYGSDVTDKYLSGVNITEANGEMIDLIAEKLVFDSARIFGTQIGVFSAFRTAANTDNWIQYFSTSNSGWIEAINEINRDLGEW